MFTGQSNYADGGRNKESIAIMKIYAVLGLAALMTGFGVAGAHAQAGTTSIYVYNFNDAVTPRPATGGDQPTLFSVDRVKGANTPNGSTLSTLSTNFAAVDVVNFAGSTVNADNSDIAGQALALQGGTDPANINGNEGHYLQASANLTGFQNVGFSFATQRTSTGFNSDQFQYSFNGTDFTNFGAAYVPNLSTAGGLMTQSFDLSSIAGLNNNANAAFRIVFNGASGTNGAGNNRFDNLIISGMALGGTPVTAPVPEASTTVSLGLMLALGGLAFAVKKKKASVAL